MKIITVTIPFLAFALASSACLDSKPKRMTKSFIAASGDSSGDSSSSSPRDEANDELGEDEREERTDGTGSDKDEGPSQVPDMGEPKPRDSVSDPKVPNNPPDEKLKPEPEPVDASCHKGVAFICEVERIINVETNKLRASSGKGALVHTKEHCFVARVWSEDMAKSGRISHDGFPAVRQADYQKEFGKSTNYLAENVAMMSNGEADAAKIANQFVTMWWNSAGHKANMLGNHKYIGSGVSKKGNAFFATQLFN